VGNFPSHQQTCLFSSESLAQRHDENILQTTPWQHRQFQVVAVPPWKQFLTAPYLSLDFAGIADMGTGESREACSTNRLCCKQFGQQMPVVVLV